LYKVELHGRTKIIVSGSIAAVSTWQYIILVCLYSEWMAAMQESSTL
jgi:hypothetical protein